MFTVINVAANAVGSVPSVAAMVASISVMVVVGVAQEIQARTRYFYRFPEQSLGISIFLDPILFSIN